MSVTVMAWVWKHSRAKGSDRLVLLAIADNANDDGGNAFPGHAELVRKTLLPRSTVYACIERLIGSGELERVELGGGRGRPTTYRVVMGNRPGSGRNPAEEPSGPPDSLGRETVQDRRRNRPGSAVASMDEPSVTIKEELPPSAAPSTQTLMAEYVDACAQRPPGRVLGQLASETKRLFDEGIDADHIRAGMAIVRDRGLHPAALASAVNQAMNPPRRNGHLRAVPAAPFATYDRSGPIPLD